MTELYVLSTSFQTRVAPWMQECFGPEISADSLERSDRFIEESLELVQSCGYGRDRAHALVDYVFWRPAGEPNQETGGVMVTLAALCIAHGLDMHAAAETELARISAPDVISKIRAKQAAKPTGSALPIAEASDVQHRWSNSATDAAHTDDLPNAPGKSYPTTESVGAENCRALTCGGEIAKL